MDLLDLPSFDWYSSRFAYDFKPTGTFYSHPISPQGHANPKQVSEGFSVVNHTTKILGWSDH